jgi:hypothetical protein
LPVVHGCYNETAKLAKLVTSVLRLLRDVSPKYVFSFSMPKTLLDVYT